MRSLDSLRPAWSGHLRHGPPPSAVITNTVENSPTKPLSSIPHSTLIGSFNQSNVLSNANDTTVTHSEASASKRFLFDSVSSQLNKTEGKADKALLLSVLQKGTGTDDIQSSNFLHEIRPNELIASNRNVPLYSREMDSERLQNEFESCSKDTKAYTDIFTNNDPNTTNDSFSTCFKYVDSNSSSKENDPFDTSKVFTPSYLQPSIVRSTNASSLNSHVPSHTFNRTSYSAHSKVNFIVHYLLYL